MLNRSSKTGPEDAEATNKPPSDTNSTQNTSSYSPATVASSSSSSASAAGGDDAVRLERLRGLRDQLANRVYRLEMDELLNASPENDNTRSSNSGGNFSVIGQAVPAQTQSPMRAPRQIPVSTSSRPVPIPVRQQVQVLAPPFNLNAARSLLRERMDEREISARTESDNLQGRHHARAGTRRGTDSRRRTAAGNGGESLITVDEFLRESRAPVRDHNGTGPAPSSPQRSTSLSPLPRIRASELRTERRSLRPRTDITPIFSPSLSNRLDSTHREERVSPDATLPQAAPWWNVGSIPAGQHAAPLNQETFDTFINHIRSIGHLQDMMLASIRSSNTSTEADSAGHGSSTVITANSSAQSSSTGSLDPTVGPTAPVPSAAVPTTAMSTATATSSTSSAPSLNAAEARLRAMQTRIDILASEFSLLRSSWALSHNESQSYERSLRRLQEYLPSARRAERARRGNRGGEISLLYEDLHADAASREAESFPRNPWGSGDSDVEINREGVRMAAAWAALGRERTESSRGIDATGGNGEGRPNAAVSTSPQMGSSTPFSLVERELQKELLAAKMEELTLQGMR